MDKQSPESGDSLLASCHCLYLVLSVQYYLLDRRCVLMDYHCTELDPALFVRFQNQFDLN